jgi:pyruvate dehydrogenase E2 component (dihydrolipoamide acetyltransferase)
VSDPFDSPWRQLATALYDAPRDGRISGVLEVDVSEAMAFLEEQRLAGTPLTITHLVTAAVARTLAEDVPELNCFVRRGRVRPRPSLDVSLAVAVEGGDSVASVCVRQAHRKSLAEIADEVRRRAERHRAGRESALNHNKVTFSAIPWPLRRPLIRLLAWAVRELGLEVRSLGLSMQSFGSVLLTNIGTHGLATGSLALLPVTGLPAAIAMGRVEEKPVVRDGQIVVRSMLPLSGTFDHRVVDGAQAGRLASGVARRLGKPRELAEPPAR